MGSHSSVTLRAKLWHALLGTVVGVGSSFGQAPIVSLPPVAQPAPAPVVPLNATPTPPAVDPSLVWPAPIPCETAPATPPPPPSYAGPLLERSKLTGNWFGTRDALRDHGFTWDISSTQFYQGVTTGGLRDGFAYGGRADYLLNINGEKAGLWKGLFIDLHGETRYGDSANDRTGTLLPVNIGLSVPVTDGTVTALTGVKITQALSENFAVFFGKINTADGFNQPFTGGAMGINGFMNAGVLFPPILARTIPYSTYGAGFAVLRNFEPVFTAAVFDTHNTPTTSGFDEFFTNGATVNLQANLPTKFRGLPGHYSIGGVYSSGTYTNLDNLPYFLASRLQGELPPLPRTKGSWAVYGLFDQAVYVDPCNPKRSWGFFGHAGITDGNPNPLKWSSAVGVGGSSVLPCRKQDSWGVGYFYAGLSDDLKNFAPRLLPLGDEYGVELFYNIGVTPWCHITPDLQIVAPARQRADTALVFGVRAKIDF